MLFCFINSIHSYPDSIDEVPFLNPCDSNNFVLLSFFICLCYSAASATVANVSSAPLESPSSSPISCLTSGCSSSQLFSSGLC